MELAILATIVAFLSIYYYFFRIPYASFVNGKDHFKEVINQQTITFFEKCFNINESEFYALRFNGESFFLRKTIPLKSIDSIVCESYRNVTTLNSSLPVRCKWRYEKLYGGPDRRFKNNPMTMTSSRYKIKFKGVDESGTMYLYDYPGNNGIDSSIQEMILKFNTMLKINKSIDLDNYIKQYLVLSKKINELKVDRFKHIKIKIALEEVEKAFFELPQALKFESNEIVNKYKNAKKESRIIQESIAQTDLQIDDLLKKMNTLCEKVRQECLNFKNMEIVKSYS